MKIPYKHLAKYIDSKPDIHELSEKLFQLGHEHEVLKGIFDMELTPNRGDCLSINGLLRDLNLFYDISNKKEIYQKDIKPFSFKFENKVKDSCSSIAFLKIEIDKIPKNYKSSLGDYFSDLDNKKINFFTDVSNYISYETGQPTHCYDSSMINEPIILDFLDKNCVFETLTDRIINIENGDLVFRDVNNKVINLAGVVGGKNTACQNNTKSVIIECAYFDPEDIIGKSLKYNINSDAAYKFERNVDPFCHDYILRRLINIIERHTNIVNVELFMETSAKIEKKVIPFNLSKINKILGTEIDDFQCKKYLEKLGFLTDQNMIQIPSYRNDVTTLNDISEEVARAIGYDSIKNQTAKVPSKKSINLNFEENKLRKLLINEGFYEVINNPFVSSNSKESVSVDNPLDSNRKYLRTDLKESLLNNLLYNERRQKDSIKLFEIADLYTNKDRKGKRAIGIIASGRLDKNYFDFSKKINNNYLDQILRKLNTSDFHIEDISRQNLDSKSKNSIIYSEIEIDSSFAVDYSYDNLNIKDISYKKYIPISEFPSSNRDLSFSIKDFSKCKTLEEIMLSFENHLLKDAFVFDYYKNENLNEIKIGFRFVFQSKDSTITDDEIKNIMNSIISEALKVDSVSIPGLK